MPVVDYSKIVIYKIQHESKDELLYVGSTTHFGNRKAQHKEKCYNTNNKIYNNKLYSTIRENGGWDAFNMVVIKEFPCKNKQEALIEEDRIMREMRSSLNTYRAYQTTEERREYVKEYDKEYHKLNRDKHKERNKKYREKNIDKCKEYIKEYYEQKKDKILEYHKEHYELNKEKINKKNKEYYKQNKEKIKEKNKEKNKEKIICQCGCAVTKYNLARHKHTKKHQAYINQQTEQ